MRTCAGSAAAVGHPGSIDATDVGALDMFMACGSMTNGREFFPSGFWVDAEAPAF